MDYLKKIYPNDPSILGVDRLITLSRVAVDSATKSVYGIEPMGTYPFGLHYPDTPIEIGFTRLKESSSGKTKLLFNRFMENVMELISTHENMFCVRERVRSSESVNHLFVGITGSTTVLELIYVFGETATVLAWMTFRRMTGYYAETTQVFMKIINVWARQKGFITKGGISEVALNMIAVSVLRSRLGVPNFEEVFLILVKLAMDSSRTYVTGMMGGFGKLENKEFIHVSVPERSENLSPDADPIFWKSTVIPELRKAIRSVHELVDQSEFEDVANALTISST